MKLYILLIAFGVCFFAVLCNKASFSKTSYYNDKNSIDNIPDMKEVLNITKIILDPLLFMQPYFIQHQTKASICYKNQSDSYKSLTNAFALALFEAALKIENDIKKDSKDKTQEQRIYDLLNDLAMTLNQENQKLKAIVEAGPMEPIGKYIDVIIHKVKNKSDNLLIIFYKVKLNECESFKSSEKIILNAYYKAERLSEQIVKALTNCIKG